MKRVKLLLAALLMIVCGVNAQEELSSDSFGVYQNGIVESVSAQEKLSSDSTQLFFDDNGELTRIKVLPEDVPNTIISPNPRKDDIVWQKTVLRVIDMREQQNRPLYYPCEDVTASTEKNLYSIIMSNVLEGKLPAYKSEIVLEQTYCPSFTPDNLLDVEKFLDNTNARYNAGEDTWSRVNYFNKGTVKYYVKIVYYFDKSTSTFHDKILAIAPLYDEKYGKIEDLHTGVFFWVPFDKLRPFLKEEFVKMNNRNTIAQVSFDEFLNRSYYGSYIIHDYDITSKDIDKGLTDPRMIRQEQQRVENEILDFEQDLWTN